MAFFSANASACVLIITFFCFSNVVCMDNLDTDFSCMTRDEIIEYYFHQGLMHKEIAAILLSVHAITASVRIVKRVLTQYRLACLHRDERNNDNFLAKNLLHLAQLHFFSSRKRQFGMKTRKYVKDR